MFVLCTSDLTGCIKLSLTSTRVTLKAYRLRYYTLGYVTRTP